MLWVGTSAGVIVTMHLPYINANTSKITVMPHLIGKFKILNCTHSIRVVSLH